MNPFGFVREPMHRQSLGRLRIVGGERPVLAIPRDWVIRDLALAARDGLMASAAGRFFAWVRGGSLSLAIAADWLTSAWDQSAALFATAPAAAVVEGVVGDWLNQLLGLPADSSFALVTGGQMANVVCLAAARHHVLHARGWNLDRDDSTVDRAPTSAPPPDPRSRRQPDH